jgi:predicted dehydrogenase
MDAVLICAATDSDDPIQLAGELSRDRGRVVAVGAVPLNVPRRPYYDKELTLLQSRSYGPGRYDASYEEQGVDYPFGYVRWTEGRNLQAFLELCASGAVQVAPLISHRFPIADAEAAYRLIAEGAEPFLGVLLTYPKEPLAPVRSVEVTPPGLQTAGAIRMALVGSGAFASGVLAPELARRSDVRRCTVVSARGLTARHLAERFGFERCATDEALGLTAPNIDAVVIATRHDLHAHQAAAALRAGKAVFLEKPLAIDRAGLSSVLCAARESKGLLFVDFNRRFAPLTGKLCAFFRDRTQPMVLVYRINAGPLPEDSWIHDPQVGGGRIVGEACHFVDLCAAITNSDVVRVQAESVSGARGSLRNEDQVVLSLKMGDGSVASICYASGGDPSLPKERLEVLCGGAAACLEDFRVLELVRGGKTKRATRLLRDKGHRAALDAFLRSVRTGEPPISLRSLASTTLATLGAVEAMQSGAAVDVRGELEALLGAEA